MITTGFTIPEVVLKRLAAAVAAFHRETAPMTMAELRKAYRERQGPTIGCFVHVEFTKTGAVKSFDARRIEKSREKFRACGFETDVPLFGRADYAARDLAKDCGEFLLRREIDQRRDADHRELVGLTNEELSNAAKELSRFKGWLGSGRSYCGSLSEQLRLRLVEDEFELREKESNHEHLEASGKNRDYIAACQKQVDDELVAARGWREAKETSPYYRFMARHEYQNRSDDDQTVIAYRDAMGWQP